MPADRHTLLTWKGVFGSAASPLEEWQVSLKTGWGTEDASLANGTTAANALKGLFQTHLMTLMPPSVILRVCDIRAIGADGKQLRNASGGFEGVGLSDTAPFAGTGTASPLLPPQCAVVVSLQSERAGATGKGRFFLPAPAGAMGTDYRLTALAQENLATGVKNFLNALNPTYGQVRVYSTKGTPGSRVVSIRVGRAIDTQRRRRGDLLESYRFEALA